MYKRIPRPKLNIGERWCDSFLVTYPVSYRYNGGITVGNRWYEGYTVPSPKVPKGFKLTSIGRGLQLNARPPCATSYLEPIDSDRKVTRKELKEMLDNT
jgi:hypothetical protein